jgi:protein-S-isoprenylcysteine O-methyltransferase Ste14
MNFRLILETALHTILLPGTVLVGLPYVILSSNDDLNPLRIGLRSILASIPIVLGLTIGFWCTRDFITRGRGTPNPLDPPKFLVAAGPYRFTRNPMYVSVGLILVGEAIAFRSSALAVYLCIVMIGFHVFVVLYEEPTLRGLFGSSYEEYCKRVPRWIVLNGRADR